MASQARRLRNDPDLREGLARFRAATPGGVQDQDFLLLEKGACHWIGSVSRAKAAPAVQEQIGYLRRYIIREVYAAFARGAGLPEGPSRRIEDWRSSIDSMMHSRGWPSSSTPLSNQSRRIASSPSRNCVNSSCASRRWRSGSVGRLRVSSVATSTSWCSCGVPRERA